MISCTVQTASQVYTKYTMLFSLASAQNLHEGPGLLLDLSCLFMDQNDILITTTKQVIKLEREESSGGNNL